MFPSHMMGKAQTLQNIGIGRKIKRGRVQGRISTNAVFRALLQLFTFSPGFGEAEI